MSQFVPMPVDTGDPMIYVACEIGNVAVEMLVDTGAHSSVISLQLARRLGLHSHIDRSQQGVVRGVGGTTNMLGKLNGVVVKLGLVEFTLSFIVINIEFEMLMLGIDLMRRFKCVINLERNCLRFGGEDGVEVPFLTTTTTARRSLRSMGCPNM